MSKILIDEAVVRQALEALEDYEYGKETTAYLAKVERATATLRQALADAVLDKMAENARELGLGYEQPDCDHNWKYIGSKRQAMWECTKCGMYKVPDAPPECKTEAEKTAYAFGWYKALESVREQPLQFGVGGGLVAIKTLLSRDPCAHANVAIKMIDAMLAEQPAQQEPVAWLWKNIDGHQVLTDDPDYADGTWTPLYTAPPAQQEPDPDELTIAYLNGIDTGKKRKPWVGLTDNEVKDCIASTAYSFKATDIARAVEAKLKEKNQ